MGNPDWEYYFTIASGLIGLLIILFMTGCKGQASRWEWSTEQQCLMDHHREACYQSAEEMAQLTYRDSADAAHLMDRARMVKRIKKAELRRRRIARQRYDNHNTSIEDIKVEDTSGLSQRQKNLKKASKYFHSKADEVPETVAGATVGEDRLTASPE
jgi:hypothetical protein